MPLPTVVSNLSDAQYRQYVLQTLDVIAGGAGDASGLSNLSTAQFRQYVLILLAQIATDGGSVLQTRTISASGAILPSDELIFVSAASGNVALTLPAAATVSGKVFIIKRVDASLNNVTITDSTSSIDGEASVSMLFENISITLASNGSRYLVL